MFIAKKQAEVFLRSWAGLLFIAVLVLIVPALVFGAFSEGTGTAADPYNVTNCTLLQEMKDYPTSNFSLKNNVNMSDCPDTQTGAGFIPVGNATHNFTGVFLGNNNNISNLFINRSSENNIGLFGSTARSPTIFIYNVGLVNVTITGNNTVGGLVGYGINATINKSYATGRVIGTRYVGGLVGYGGSATMSSTTINNSYATASVNGTSYVGGLVGFGQSARIDNSYATGSVTGTSNSVGGLVGYGPSARIDNSYATGSVYGISYVGGLVGSGEFATINDSYATGSVTGSNQRVGGLVGYGHYATIDNSYATGDATGTNTVGGLVGSGAYATIDNSYATGSVTGTSDRVGGLVGYGGWATIDNSYATGSVNGTQRVGGLVGDGIQATINKSYATGSVNGTDRVGGLVGSGESATIKDSYATGSVNSDAAGVGGLVGNASSATITNSFWFNNSDDALRCYPGGDTGCTVLSTVLGNLTSFFYNSSNPPMNVWNFTHIWQEKAGNYPVLWFQDATPPAWSAPLNVTPATFDKASQLNFSINWTDNIGVTGAWFEVNRSGTLTLYAGNVTGNVWNLSLTGFPAGTHYWRSNATDGAGNVNTTGWYAFTIATTAPTINLTINGSHANVTVGESSNFTINGTQLIGDGGTTLSLHINSSATHFNNGTGSLQNVTSFADRGVFNVTLRYPATQNYTAENMTLWITVQDQTVPVISSASSSVTGQTTATITWTTDDSANSSVTIGTSSFTSSTLTTSHSVAVTGLSSGTTYTATIQSSNQDGYSGSSSTSFTTTAASSGGSALGGGGAATPLPSSTTVVQSIKADTSQSIGVSKADEIGIISVKVEVIADVSNVEVKVTKLAEQPSSVATSASANVYRYLEVTTKRLASADIKQVKFDFKVERSWLAEKAVQAKDVVLLRYAGGKWSELSTQQTSSDTTYVYFTATSPGFSVFAIGTRAAAEEPVTPPEVPPEQPPTGEVITPSVTPPVKPPAKGFFQSALFIIAVGTVLAVTGVGFIYRNRLAIIARIDDLLGKLKGGREDHVRRKRK